MSFITGVGLTSYGKHEGSSSLDLMSKAAEMAVADAGLKRSEIDGILCGYSTVSPHIMLATVFAEHFGTQPSYAHAVQVGGATGLAMTMLAHHLVDAGVAKHVLVVGGENRLTGQSRDASIQALAQVGHPDYEVTLGPTIPAYYGLVASRYMHEYGVTQEDLAEFAVLMRAHALTHPGAQFHEPITLAMLLEDLGLAGRGEAAARVRAGHFGRDGAMPLNTHGGLLSYGHCGVGGAMAHLVETHLQMTERAGTRQVRDASIALLHGDGGVLSSHVSMFLERVR